MEIQRKSMQKLDKLIERIFLTGKVNHNVELLVIADDLRDIKKTFLEEEKEFLDNKKSLPLSDEVITSDKVDDLNRDYEDPEKIR